MTASEFIRQFEGCRLDAYEDVVGVTTIGIGHVTHIHQVGDTITQDQADEYLAHDIGLTEDCLTKNVNVPLTANQRIALQSFIFNLGCGAFKGSTLLKLLNAGEYEKAAEQFPRWQNAAGKPIPGLLRRRLAEQKLFLEA